MELHITAWNCERLSPYITPNAPQARLGDVFQAFGSPHLVCLQEVRLRARDAADVENATYAAPGYRGHFNLCADPRNAKSSGGRLYGVATYVGWGCPPCTFRTLPWDREGRVLIAECDALNLTLVNWYNVNGTDRPYYDLQTGELAGDRHGFKLRSQQALLDALVTLPKGRRLVVIGDFNVTPTAYDITPRLRTGAPFVAARTFLRDTFAPTLQLVDIYRTLHPHARQFTWFNRAVPAGYLDAARVDYALVSQALVPHVLEARIDESTERRFGSDHAPVHLKLLLESPGK